MSADYQYKTDQDSSSWMGGSASTPNSADLKNPTTTTVTTRNIDLSQSRSVFDNTTSKYINKFIDKKNNIIVEERKFNTIIDDNNKKMQLYNEDYQNVQNSEGFPRIDESSPRFKGDARLALKYNYQIIMDDPKYKISMTLENKLKDMRASLGIPVHGRNDLAKAMKYYMYNRYKIPDKNMAHNKTFTHVFFTRPDCNLLQQGSNGYTLNKHAIKNQETLLLWRRNPELFKLLTNSNRCNDSHNLNLLLSNQVTSIDIQDENLSTVEAGKSWGQYEMVYGDVYTGRFAGEVSCNFTETNDYSIINLMKLWITYIDAVSRGAWSPSYNLWGDGFSAQYTGSHVYTKTLDYASSIDIFKVGPDGESVLYWSKYYGIFPINTGANALAWDVANSPGDTPKLNIRFKYSFKRDLSPIALLEFNKNTNGVSSYEPAYNSNYAGTVRPYVGCPYIEFTMRDPGIKGYGLTNLNTPVLDIRLKFNRFKHTQINDDLLYKNNLGNRRSD